jgi:hypothetical protein
LPRGKAHSDLVHDWPTIYQLSTTSANSRQCWVSGGQQFATKLAGCFRCQKSATRESLQPVKNLDRQLGALVAEGCDRILQEKVSGKRSKNRPGLEKANNALGTDDVLVLAEWVVVPAARSEAMTTLRPRPKRLHRRLVDLETCDCHCTNPLSRKRRPFKSCLSRSSIEAWSCSCDQQRAEHDERIYVALGRMAEGERKATDHLEAEHLPETDSALVC